ncbi:hypothetical protein GCM10009119_12420 [Algoriphagus jejuensis]|uniref:Uncharacterized protein n=1 Tax=Algoriphagus jejuensis TaxID=419934 RepID=A0ABN1MYR8_9BACT
MTIEIGPNTFYFLNNTGEIILMGASKGAKLVFNLMIRFPHFTGVIAISTSHLGVPVYTLLANTSSG